MAYNLNASLQNGKTYASWVLELETRHWKYSSQIGKHNLSSWQPMRRRSLNGKLYSAGRDGFLTNDIL